MRILAPLSVVTKARVARLHMAGADEIYFGFNDDTWARLFGPYANLNRMSDFGDKANSMTLDEAVSAVETVRQVGCKAFITLNAPRYDDLQQKRLDFILSRFAETRPQGIIVSSLRLGEAAIEHGLEPVASTMSNICNTDIANEYYLAGFRRMILPRELSISEITAIINAFPDVAFEVFGMRSGCMFCDSNCLARHSLGVGPICGALRFAERDFYYRTKENSFSVLHDNRIIDQIYSGKFMQFACSLCAIYRLLHAGVNSLKIVGRADDEGPLLKDIALVKANIGIAMGAATEELYLNEMLMPDERELACTMGYSCYYPEVRFPIA